MYDAVGESVLVEELEVGAHVGRQCGLAPTEDEWPDEQLELVDQTGHESLCCEVRTTHKEIPTGGRFQAVRSERAARVESVSQTAIVSYMQRP